LVTRWDTMGLDGTRWGLDGTLWGSMGLDGTRWGSMGLDRTRWDSMGLNGTRWDSMGTRWRLDGTRWRILKPGHTLRIIPRSASDILCFLGPFAARGMLQCTCKKEKGLSGIIILSIFECVSPKYLSKCINCREKVCAKEVILGLMFLLTCFLSKVIVTYVRVRWEVSSKVYKLSESNV
jgi:hypothetical protein